MLMTLWTAYRMCLKCHLGLVRQESQNSIFLPHSVSDGWFRSEGQETAPLSSFCVQSSF